MIMDMESAAGVTVLMIATLVFWLQTADGEVGANYGTLGSNLPPPTEVLALCEKYNIKSIRIFDPNPSILEALSDNPNMSVIIGVPNLDIPRIANNANVAKSWVEDNILKYKNVNIKCITVGNEINPLDLDPTTASIASSIAPAMETIHDAISAAGLTPKVKVSTVLSTAVLGNSYPPSAGQFKPEIMAIFIKPIIRFLTQIQAPLLVNIYPYFSYISDPNNFSLDHALFTSSGVVKDGEYQYFNLFSAMVDAFFVALEKAGEAHVGLVVSETGWPSDGGMATSIKNSETYNSNLVKSVKRGTPRKPENPIETYIFDLIDEDQKSPEVEKHWGLFLPRKEPKYSISFE